MSFSEMLSWVVNPFGINESSNLSTEEEEQPVMGIRRGTKRAFAPPWKLGLRSEFFQKTWRQQLNSYQLIYFLRWHFICHCDTHTAQGNRASATPKNFFKLFQMLGTTTSYHHYLPDNSATTCYDHFAHENISWFWLCAWVNGLFKINAYWGFFSHSIKLHRGLLSMRPCWNTS